MASSRYISHGLNLTDNQLEKIIRASQNKQGVVVRITKDNLNGNVHKIPLTKTQINRINKAKNGLNLFLSSSQLNGISNGDVVGNGIISDAASRIPVVGPFIVPILKRLGLGLADINTITKGGCVRCNGICVKKVGGGLFIETGKGLNLGSQNSGNGLF